MKTSHIKSCLAFFFIFTLLFTTVGCSADNNDSEEKDTTNEAWIGVYVQDLDDELRGYFDLDDDEGVIVNRIVADSPADDAGLQDEDLIIRFDRKRIGSAQDLAKAVQKMSPGDKAKIELIREDDRKTVQIKIGERPEYEVRRKERYGAKPPLPAVPPVHLSFNQAWLGIEMTEMNDDLADYFDVDEDDGILILSVVKDSPADEAGLKSGDVLMKIADERIRSKDDVVDALSNYEAGEEIEVEIKRKGRKKTLDVELGSGGMQKYHGFNREDWRKFRDDMQRWKHDFKREMNRTLPQLEHELKSLRDIEIPVEDIEEIEEEIRKELSEVHEQIQRELQKIEIDIHLELEESL